MSFLSAYWPKASELSEEQLLDSRVRAEQTLRPVFSGVDFRPGAVAGDHVLSPFALLMACFDEAARRWLSDIDLANTENGITPYSCDFVRAFIANFGVRGTASLRSRGIVRLTFTDGEARTIARGTQLQINGVYYDLMLPFDGDLDLIPDYRVLSENANSLRLAPLGGGAYAADVPVAGDPTEETLPATGDAATFNALPDGLVSATALGDFLLGAAPDTLARQAMLARKSKFGANLSSTGGAESLLLQEFPDLISANAVSSADPSNLRASVSPMGILRGRMDLCVRSAIWDSRQALTVTCKQCTTSEGVFYVAELLLPQPVTYVEKITHASTGATSAITLLPISGFQIYSRSLAPNRAPYATCANSKLEKLFLVIPQPVSLFGTSAVTTYVSGSDVLANFELTLVTDPVFNSVDAVVSDVRKAPVGVDVLLRNPSLIVLDTFELTVIRKTGFRPNQEQMRQEILSMLRSASYPDKQISYAKCADHAFFNGYQDVVSIRVAGRLVIGTATHVLKNPEDDPLTTPDDLTAVAVPSRTISSLDDLRMTEPFTDPDIGETDETLAWATAGTTAVLVDETVIRIIEQR